MALSPLFTLILLLPLTLFSMPLDFKACQLKYQVSSLVLGQTQAFAVSDEYALFYSKSEPSFEIVKRDPFLGLNLIKAAKPFRHSFKFYNHLPQKLAGILPQEINEGKLLSEQLGLNRLAKFSTPLKENTLISDRACGIIGVVTSEGVVDKEYIRHFLESKTIRYADAGIRLVDKSGVCVNARNPFFTAMPFAVGDIILYMDGKKAESAAQISREILLAKPNSRHDFVVNRKGKEQTLKIDLQNRLGGGLLSDTFLESFGFVFDERLVVKNANPKYGVKKGDKLRSVMGQSVKTWADVRQALSQENSSADQGTPLLIQREGFDFFIHLCETKERGF